jgi:hypothetical protein
MSVSLITLQPLSAIPIVPSVGVTSSSTTSDQVLKSLVSSSTPQFVSHVVKLDYDKEVLQPFHIAQAKLAEEKRIAAEKACTDQGGTIQDNKCILPPPPVIEAPPVTITVDIVDNFWSKLRQCESGGNYATNTGNGFYGAYQFDLQTWAGYGGYARPDLAPPAIQDAKAQQTQNARGWQPWPACSAKLGLSSGGS